MKQKLENDVTIASLAKQEELTSLEANVLACKTTLDLYEKSETRDSYVTKDVMEKTKFSLYEAQQKRDKCRMELEQLRKAPSDYNEEFKQYENSIDSLDSDEELETFPTKKNEKKTEYKITDPEEWTVAKVFNQTFFYPFHCRCGILRKQEDLKAAAHLGEISVLKHLIKKKVNVNGRGLPSSLCAISKGFFDKTPLMLAVQERHLNCITALVTEGANVNLQDSDGYSALNYAQINNDKKVIDYLIEHGAQTNVLSKKLN